MRQVFFIVKMLFIRRRLTANFAEDNPNTIVEVIAETMGFTIARKDDEILLEGSGCLEK